METAEVTRMKELVQKLNEAAKAYYQEDREIMSNREYDALYDELEQAEKITGIVLADSPTVRVGYEAVDALPKETHESPMLSLDKTKDREVLRGFIGKRRTAEGSHQGKWYRWRSYHQQCTCFSKHSVEDRISGKTGASWRGNHYLL